MSKKIKYTLTIYVCVYIIILTVLVILWIEQRPNMDIAKWHIYVGLTSTTQGVNEYSIIEPIYKPETKTLIWCDCYNRKKTLINIEGNDILITASK